MASKTTCPVSRSRFVAKATSIQLTLGGQPVLMAPKQFSTGSMGWGANQKVTIMVDGVPVLCQLGLNLTVVGSKELPGEDGVVSGGAAPSVGISPEVQAIIDANRRANGLEAAQVA